MAQRLYFSQSQFDSASDWPCVGFSDTRLSLSICRTVVVPDTQIGIAASSPLQFEVWAQVGFRSSWTFTHCQLPAGSVASWSHSIILLVRVIVLHSAAVRLQSKHDLGAQSRSGTLLDLQGYQKARARASRP